ncbi:MAG: tetratricopeptide repeat protein [Actinomycetota bacterium]|nr:tetratricopeptide repeat protein [Actinomycetota bacterium]
MDEPGRTISPALAALIAETDRLEDDWRWDDALAAWDRARSTAGDDVRLLAECESGRARVLFTLGRVEEADDADEAAVGHFAAAGEPALAKLCEASLAWRSGMMGRVEDALIVGGQARDAIDAMGDDASAPLAGARVRQMLARTLFAAGRPDEGELQYLEARDRFADAGDDRRLARCDAALALDLLGAGRLEDAEGRAEAAVAGLTMLDRPVDAAQLQLVLGRVQAEGERYEESLVNFRAAFEVFSERELWPAAAEAIHFEALVLAAMEHHEPAIERFHEAIAVAEKLGMSGGAGTSRLELAGLLGRLGRLDDAVIQFESARVALTAAEDPFGVAHATYGLGTAHRAAGDLNQALNAFSVAAESFAAIEAVGAQAQALLDGGTVLVQLGRVDDGLAWFEDAAEGFALDGEPLHLALVRRSWGAAAGFASRPDGVEALAEARSVFAEHGATWDVAECDLLSAQVLGLLGRHDEAVTAAETAVAGFRDVDDAVTLVAAETMHGRALVDAGRPGDAVSHLERAVASSTSMEAVSLAAPAHAVLADALDALDQPEAADTHRATAERLAAEDEPHPTER